MRVLSLFDWMSCGMVALKRAWIQVDEYYASEIDKYAIQISKKNHPDIIQLWDINNWKDWNLWGIDMIIWWSPCQWFSIAWKQLNFEDPRSKLFFEYSNILKYYKPKYFLLENVKMKKEFQSIISDNLFNIKPIKINSALVSAQNRERLYWVWELQSDWTYKPLGIAQPKDKLLAIKDILEDNVWDEFYLNEQQVYKIRSSKFNQERTRIQEGDKCWCLLSRDYKDPQYVSIIQLNNPIHSNNRIFSDKWKSPTLNTMQGGNRQPKILSSTQTNATLTDNKSSPMVSAMWTWWWHIPMVCGNRIRKLTPMECERLQTVPDWYTEWVSKSQRYKMLWNWRTVDVISHIFSHIKS